MQNKPARIQFYFYKGIPFGKKLWAILGVNNVGDRYFKLVLPFCAIGFTYGK